MESPEPVLNSLKLDDDILIVSDSDEDKGSPERPDGVQAGKKRRKRNRKKKKKPEENKELSSEENAAGTSLEPLSSFIYYRRKKELIGPISRDEAMEIYGRRGFTRDTPIQLRDYEDETDAPFFRLSELVARNGLHNPFVPAYCDVYRDLKAVRKQLEKVISEQGVASAEMAGRLAELDKMMKERSKIDLRKPQLAIDEEVDDESGQRTLVQLIKRPEPLSLEQRVSIAKMVESLKLIRQRVLECDRCDLLFTTYRTFIVHKTSEGHAEKRGNNDHWAHEMFAEELEKWRREDGVGLAVGRKRAATLTEEERAEGRPSSTMIRDIGTEIQKVLDDKVRRLMTTQYAAKETTCLAVLLETFGGYLMRRVEKHLSDEKYKIFCRACEVVAASQDEYYRHCQTNDHIARTPDLHFKWFNLMIGMHKRDIYFKDYMPFNEPSLQGYPGYKS